MKQQVMINCYLDFIANRGSPHTPVTFGNGIVENLPGLWSAAWEQQMKTRFPFGVHAT